MRRSRRGKAEGWGRSRHLLCNFLANPFVCCCHLILLQTEVLQIVLGSFLLSECNKHQAKPYPVDHCWRINVDGGSPVQMGTFMIRFFIFIKKGLLFLFQDCLNVAIMWNLKLILSYYLAHIPYILILYKFWWSVPVFSVLYIRQTPAVVS